MKKSSVLLLFLLCACTRQILNTESIDVDYGFESNSKIKHNKYPEDEEIALQPDSVKKKSIEQKSNAPESDKPIEKKDEVTYGPVRHQDTTVSFKTLPSVNDSSKEQGSSGYISKGANGLNRKEVRDVYINGNYSYTETVKETYLVTKPIDEQKWIGTKEIVQDDDSWESLGYHFYKKYDSFETCNVQADELARINSKTGWLSTLCDGPNLYYTLRE